MKNPNVIALVEIGGSHDECLLTQLSALSAKGVEVHLICSSDIANRNSHFADFTCAIHSVEQDALSKKQLTSRVWALIKEVGATKVVFNTAQGGVIRNICIRALFSRIEFIGIIHTTRKFKGSFTQKLINLKIKKYLLLSEYLLSTIETKSKVDYFYPIRFYGVNKEASTNEEVIISVIGGVETRRKDLDGFIEMLKGLKIPIKFQFLGKSDSEKEEVSEFIQNLKKNDLYDKVELFDHFISQELFDQKLKTSDFILPLVHPNTSSAEQYFRNQISGAMTVSFGYKVPLLIHEHYQFISEMEGASFYYSPDKFQMALEFAIEGRQDKVELMKQLYIVEEQEKRYSSFVLS